MATQRALYDQFAWCFTREGIGKALRERYAVPKELPQHLAMLVSKLGAVESNQFSQELSPRSRTLVGKLDAIEGNYLSRYAASAEPRRVGPSDDDWPVCT